MADNYNNKNGKSEGGVGTADMTALISLFARAYHYKVNKIRVFGDNLAEKLLTDGEYMAVSQNMSAGASFFDSSFKGSGEDALRYVTDNFLSATPLSRAVFFEERLKNAVRIGAEQLLIIGSGYETFPYRQPVWAQPLEIFELDKPEMIEDKKSRLERAGLGIPENVFYIGADLTDVGWEDALKDDYCFDRESITFCSMLGVVNYLTPSTLSSVFKTLFNMLPEGSGVVFDYPNSDADSGTKKRRELAEAAAGGMKSSYTYKELEALLSECGLLIYEHMTPDEITKKYFERYNTANINNRMKAASDTCFCLAVKAPQKRM